MGRAVVDPVFTFEAAPSTSTRGLATMVLISAFMLSIVIARLTAHVVAPVLINVAPAMIRSLVYGSAPQVIAIGCSGVIVSASLMLPGTAV